MMMTKISTDKYCAHCNSLVKENGSIFDEERGLYFCCNGCSTVYDLISSKGLSSFYVKRTATDYKPFEQIKINSDFFNKSITNLPEGDIELSIVIDNIRCASCIWLIERALLDDGRIKSIRINYSNHKAKIRFSPLDISIDDMLEIVTTLGYCPLPITDMLSKADKERKDYFYRFITALFLTMQLMLYSGALYTGYFQGIEDELRSFFQYVSFLLATPVVLYCAYPFFKNSIKAARHRHWTMDTLVAIGSGTAYIYSVVAIFTGHESYFDTAATIITLILLGRFIEAGAKQRGGDAVSKLLNMRPLTVKKVLDIKDLDNVILINIEEMKIGELFLIEKGTSVALDGKIVYGESDINESMLTGEPLPVSKSKGDEVYSGSINLSGKLVATAIRIGDDTFLSKIAAAVDDAESSKADIQNFADKFISYFVPTMLLISILTFIGWSVFSDNELSSNIMRAVSVIVVACPCAMGLATPLAIINSASKLMNIGIIFKNGQAIERMAMVNDIYLDKTGTITESKMKVVDYEMLNEYENSLDIIGKITYNSTHPASKSISNFIFKDSEYVDVDNSFEFTEYPGKGIEADVKGVKYLIGNHKLMKDFKVEYNSVISSKMDQYIATGKTVVLTAIDNKLFAVFAITDTIRSEAKMFVDQLIDDGNRVTLLTGDNHSSAKYMLSSNDISVDIISDISPFDKADVIDRSKDINKTCMIGDGVNDAVALTKASVGISMRNSTDISMESASAILLRNDLTIINKAQKICKKSLRIMKENLLWSFSYNIVAIPLAVAGYIHPVMSAAFMSFSSLMVILNSSRLRK